jgi:uncharacterized protein (DUF433 family)
MNWRERIERDPHTPHGKLHVRGTTIPVSVVLDNLAARLDLREVLVTYPSLSEDDVRACVAWAAEISDHGTASALDADADESPEPAEATEPPAPAAASAPKRAIGFKEFLRSMPDAGEDADFERPRDDGRPEIEWDT